MRILVMQGPNLNMLGKREPEIYGNLSLDDLHDGLRKIALEHHLELDFFQSNTEGGLIERLHRCTEDGTNGVLINPAGYSHTSIALADAIALLRIPVVEVHITNIFAREEMRRHSVTAMYTSGFISGFGPLGYQLGLISLMHMASR